MATTINQLTALRVAKLKAPGYHADGGGLHLQVSQSGARSWIFTYRFTGRAREMGLGSLQRVSLAAARAERDRCNQLLRAHLDPIEDRRKERAAAILQAHGTISFADAIDKYLTAHRAEWTPKHFKAWQQTLTEYAAPELGRLLVSDIATAHIVRTLEPKWPTPTAVMLRGRLEKVLDWAAVHGYREQGDNPARWKGNLDHLLANPSRSRKVEHHVALSIDEMPRFMAALRKQQGPVARCLEFVILTAARADEARRATPAEIEGSVWTVPANRIKARKEHRVPLCERAAEIAGQGGADYCSPACERTRSTPWRCAGSSKKWATASARASTASAQPSAIGRPSAPPRHARFASKPWRTRSATRSKPLTGGATCSTSAGGSWSNGEHCSQPPAKKVAGKVVSMRSA